MRTTPPSPAGRGRTQDHPHCRCRSTPRAGSFARAMKRSLIALLAVALLALAALPATGSAAATRRCPQTDPANGLSGLRAGGLSCAKAFRVARRTNSVKCFLNGDVCTHTYKGRAWTCRLTERSLRVTCRSGGKVVRYRLG